MNGQRRAKRYLSAIEVAKYLKIPVKKVYEFYDLGLLRGFKSTSGQYRFDLEDVESLKRSINLPPPATAQLKEYKFSINGTTQIIYIKDARQMSEVGDNSVHLVITSPPYFNAKFYSTIDGDLGNIDDLDEWLNQIEIVWKEVYRVLQPGRKAFINIMNLPVKEGQSFRSLNLVGKTIDICEKIGFIFRRDIIWHKTNSVRASFGTYPYPGNILINYAHEFILEFEKPAPKGYKKYQHLTPEQKEASKLEKEFWIEIKKSDVWVINPVGSGDKRDHPAPFPLEIPYRLIKAYSFVGETILDPFLGSGTTLIASIKLKRNCIGYEINPEIASELINKLSLFKNDATT